MISLIVVVVSEMVVGFGPKNTIVLFTRIQEIKQAYDLVCDVKCITCVKATEIAFVSLCQIMTKQENILKRWL